MYTAWCRSTVVIILWVKMKLPTAASEGCCEPKKKYEMVIILMRNSKQNSNTIKTRKVE